MNETTPASGLRPGEFSMYGIGDESDWERWISDKAAFCIETINDVRGVSIRTKGQDADVTVQPMEMTESGLQATPGVEPIQSSSVEWERVDFLRSNSPENADRVVIAVVVRALSNSLDIYCRSEEERNWFVELLSTVQLNSDGQVYPGSVLAECLQTDPPDWPAPQNKPAPKPKLAPPKAIEPLKDQAFNVPTSQEFAELLAAAADGQYGSNYTDDPQSGVRIHARKGSPFITRIQLSPHERAAGCGVDMLAEFTRRQNADSAFMILYVSHLLAPQTPLPRGAYAGGWVDLNDVARKIGLNMRTAADAENSRRAVWDLIRFGARANVIGERSTVYRDPSTGQQIPTQIDSAPWQILKKERPIQADLFDTDVPMRVELVMAREWTALTTRPETAQYLPFGEVLGAIPPGKAGGAWARVIGLAYLGFCRRNPREVLGGQLQPTRRELLDQYKPAVSPYQELIDGPNPIRIAQYWFSALSILADSGILAKTGEAATVWETWKSSHSKQPGWVNTWLNGPADLSPGELLLGAMRERAESLPTPRPRRLGKKRGKEG